jgi:uncharacterized protein YdaU (DUF1376 family)
MAEFPAMPLFTDAYLADTLDLTTEQHGIYLLMMVVAWRRPKCSLPANPSELRQILPSIRDKHGHTFNRLVVPILERFWQKDEEGNYVQKRLSKEREFVRKRAIKQKQNADKRWIKAKQNSDESSQINDLTDADGYAPTPTPTPTIESSSVLSCSSVPFELTSTQESILRAPEVALVNGNGNGHKQRKKQRTMDEIRKALGPERLPWWENWWRVYPCHEGTKAAMEAFERTFHDREKALLAYRGAQAYADRVGAEPQTILKWGQGWINEERWLDENRIRVQPRRSMTPTEQALALEKAKKEKANV